MNAIFFVVSFMYLHANFIPDISQRDTRQSLPRVWHVTPEEKKKNDYLGRRSGLRRQFDGKKITLSRRR